MQISVVLYCVVYNVQLYVRYAMCFNTVLQSKNNSQQRVTCATLNGSTSPIAGCSRSTGNP